MTTYTWVGVTNQSWSTPSNWSPSTDYPRLAGDNVILDASASAFIIDVDISGIIVNSISITGAAYSVTSTLDDIITFSAPISGADLVDISNGTLILSNSLNVYDSLLVDLSGTLVASVPASLGTNSNVNNGLIIFDAALSGLFIPQLISGTGGVDVSGTLVFTGNNTYGGTTTLTPTAILRVGADGTVGSLGTGPVIIGTDAFFILRRSDTITFNNNISGPGRLNVDGLGTTTLTGTNTYSGLTRVRNGILIINSKSIISNETSNINDKTKRTLQTLSHSKYREILKHQGKKYKSEVRFVNEYLTTKKCNKCEKLNEVGRSEIYECECGLKIGRDINSAINIKEIEKYMVEEAESDNEEEE